MMLEGKVAWITGASRGIGRATALAMAREGARLVLNARDEQALLLLSEEIQDSGGLPPLVRAYDVADQSKVKDACLAISKELGRLDVLVNNAGILQEGLLGMTTPDAIQQMFSINTFSVIYHTQLASRLMMRNRSGSIINLSSLIGRVGKEGLSVYGATKAAVSGFTISAAKELAPFAIRVNALAPGLIDTEMAGTLSPEKIAERISGIKMKRMGTAEEVAGVALFLASELSAYVTGQIIGVDGCMLE